MAASVAEIGSAAQGGLLHYTAWEKNVRTVARLYACATPKNRGIHEKVDELGLETGQSDEPQPDEYYKQNKDYRKRSRALARVKQALESLVCVRCRT